MAAEIRITISSSSSGSAIEAAKKDVQDLGQTAEKSGKGFSALKEIGIGALRELGAAATNAALGGLKMLGGAVMEGIADAREAAKINAQTAAVLKSTGNAAGVSAEHVQDYAAALSAAAGKSLFGDSQIQESTNLLLTFTNIKGTVLDAATAISVDMAQALGGAPKDAAIQLGKALNDPVKGVTALTRVGVTFSQEQKDMIQALVDTGDVAGAQAIILEELNKEFGGSAEAAAKADGGWAQFNDRLGEAKETIGAAILPLLSMLVGFLNDSILPAVEAAATAFSAWLADPATQAGIQTLVDTLGGILIPIVNEVIRVIGVLIGYWQDAGEQTGSLTERLGYFLDTLIGVQEDITGPFQSAVLIIGPLIDSVIAAFASGSESTTAFGGVLQDLGLIWTQYRTLVEAELAAIWAIIQAVFAQIMVFWQAHGTEIMAFVQTTWDTIVQIITLALELIQAVVVPMLQAIAAFINAHGAEIQAFLSNTWTIISGLISAALTLIKGIITAALQLIKGDFTGAWETIKTMSQTFVLTMWQVIKAGMDNIYIVWQLVWNQIKAFFQGIMDGIVGWVLQTLQGIVNAITGFAGEARSAAGGVADAIVDGIASGIENGIGAIVDAAKNAARAALDAAMDFLNASSPSRKFMEIGQWSAEGMAIGLTQGAPMVAGAGAAMAGAALSGAASTVNNSRTLNYSPTIHTNKNSESLDFSTALSLAGV